MKKVIEYTDKDGAMDRNLSMFTNKLKQIGIDGTELEKRYGDIIKRASFTTLGPLAYEGSLLDTVMFKLTPYALKINEAYPEEMQLDKNLIIKICFLHQIAKAIRLIKNTNAWEIEKRGMIYTYDNSQPAIRTGLQSLVMATECGITFDSKEAESMTINDREPNDEQSKWYSSQLSSIIKMANEMVYIEANNIKEEK